MPVSLKMVGLVVADMARSLAFYRRLGLDLPAGADAQPHVELTLPGDLVFFWNAAFVTTDDPGREAPSGGYRIIVEFALDDRGAVDAAYADLTGLGHRGHRAPFTSSFGAYMAMVDDPDGNTVLLAAG